MGSSAKILGAGGNGGRGADGITNPGEDGGDGSSGLGIEHQGTIVNYRSGSVDFSTAGGLLTSRRYMVPPKVSNTQRGNLTGLVSGAMIYNTNLNKLQVYNGSGWETVTSS